MSIQHTINVKIAETKNRLELRDQKSAFDRLSPKFISHYKSLERADLAEFTTPYWKASNDRLEKVFAPQPRFDFLRDQTILDTMFVNAGGAWLEAELKYLEEELNHEQLRSEVKEDAVGMPNLLAHKYRTSHNSIHHLYHLVRYINETGTDINKFDTVVEWGGGYGNLAKIFDRMRKKPSTYVMIDTPLFSCLQWLYLSSIFGENRVNLVEDSKVNVEPGKFNIVPLNFLDSLDIKADLFISTWAISESAPYSQDYVLNKGWYGAKHLLLAYQASSERFPKAGRIGELAEKMGAKPVGIDFLPGNFYAFK